MTMSMSRRTVALGLLGSVFAPALGRAQQQPGWNDPDQYIIEEDGQRTRRPDAPAQGGQSRQPQGQQGQQQQGQRQQGQQQPQQGGQRQQPREGGQRKRRPEDEMLPMQRNR